MVSKNKLLGNVKPLDLGMSEEELEGASIDAVTAVDATESGPDVTTRTRIVPILMYSLSCREGKVFTIQKELDALGLEWTDHPGKIFKLPGFEHLYEGDKE